MFGYMGTILHINLKTQKITEKQIRPEFCKTYIGGTGFATRLLYEHSEARLDPLSPDNPLIFSLGPFAGTSIAVGDKYAVAAKSPLTGFIGDSLGGSFWSRELKKAGYDALVIHKKAKQPTYLYIDDGSVQLRDAKILSGKSSWETEEILREELGDEQTKIASIGIAGEKLIPFANISNDMRTAGRTGMGAVMGSKNLKAIAIRGTKTIEVANLEKLLEKSLLLYESAQGPATEKYRILGTTANVLVFNAIGNLPTKNFQQTTFRGAEQISAELIMEKYVTNIVGCSSCPIACDHNVAITARPYAGTATSIDYESIFALGSNVGVDDAKSVIKAIELCDIYGLDTISTGVVISWAMECYERELISKNETEGLDLTFGNTKTIHKLIPMIARKEGLGRLLSLGTKKASEKIGKGSDHFAMHIKGLELPGYDIRGLKTAALGWAVAARGACHNRSGAYDYDIGGKVDRFKADQSRGKLAMESEDQEAIFDSLIWCKFIRRCFEDFHREASTFYNLVTGFDIKPHDLKRTGERIVNLKKVYNIREGWTRSDDHLPPRVMKDPIPDGFGKGSKVSSEEFNLMLTSYYKARGWTKYGLPRKAKLVELGLEDTVKGIGVA